MRFKKKILIVLCVVLLPLSALASFESVYNEWKNLRDSWNNKTAELNATMQTAYNTMVSNLTGIINDMQSGYNDLVAMETDLNNQIADLTVQKNEAEQYQRDVKKALDCSDDEECSTKASQQKAVRNILSELCSISDEELRQRNQWLAYNSDVSSSYTSLVNNLNGMFDLLGWQIPVNFFIYHTDAPDIPADAYLTKVNAIYAAPGISDQQMAHAFANELQYHSWGDNTAMGNIPLDPFLSLCVFDGTFTLENKSSYDFELFPESKLEAFTPPQKAEIITQLWMIKNEKGFSSHFLNQSLYYHTPAEDLISLLESVVYSTSYFRGKTFTESGTISAKTKIVLENSVVKTGANIYLLAGETIEILPETVIEEGAAFVAEIAQL